MSKEACSAMHAMFFQSVFPGYCGFPQSAYTCQFVLWEVSLTDAILHRDSLRPRQQRPFQLQGLEIQTPRIEEIMFSLRVFPSGCHPSVTAKKNCLYRVLDHTLLIRWSVTVVNQDVNFYIIHTCLHIKTQLFILNVKLIFVTLSPVTWLTQVRLRGHVH